MEGSGGRRRPGDDGPRRPADGHDGRLAVVRGVARGRRCRGRSGRSRAAAAHPAPGPPAATLASGIARAVTSRLPTRSTLTRRLLIATDAAVLGLCTIASLALADPDGRAAGQVLWALAYVAALLALFRLYGLYERDSKRLGHSTLDDVPQVFHAVLIGTLGMWPYLEARPGGAPSPGSGSAVLRLEPRRGPRRANGRAEPDTPRAPAGACADRRRRRGRATPPAQDQVVLVPAAASGRLPRRCTHGPPSRGGPRAPRDHCEPTVGLPGERRRARDHGVHRARRAAHDRSGARGQPCPCEGERAAVPRRCARPLDGGRRP